MGEFCRSYSTVPYPVSLDYLILVRMCEGFVRLVEFAGPGLIVTPVRKVWDPGCFRFVRGARYVDKGRKEDSGIPTPVVQSQVPVEPTYVA